MTVQYSNFKVVIFGKPDDEPITAENFLKRDIWIMQEQTFDVRISKDEVSLWQVRELLSGDEKRCKNALGFIAEDRMFYAKKIEKLCR